MGKNFITLSIFLFAVAVSLLFHHMRGNGGDNKRPEVAPFAKSKPCEFRGISLQIHSGDPDRSYREAIKEISQTGANAISFVVHGNQETTKSSYVYIDHRNVPGKDKLRKMIHYAHACGLQVMIMPVVRLTHSEGSWRGKINPENWKRWWSSYTEFILHFARIAEETKTEILSVGSELISTVKQEEEWRNVIKAVRKRYSGRLIYSANWDWYKVAKWWDALDLVGMTSYYTIGKGTDPGLAEMLDAWKKIRSEILDWQKKIGKSIIFTEAGWPNQNTAAEYPWNYYKAPDSPDPQQQARCFESFFRTWADVPQIAGYFIWEWRDSLDFEIDPAKDTSYRPCGKPAMKIIKKYFNRTSAESTPAEKTAPKTSN